VTPTIRLLNDALQIHALLDGAYGRYGRQNHWRTRGYKGTYYSRTQTNPFFVAQDALRAYDPHGADYDADFWKLKEVGLRYGLPESLAGRIGAQNAALLLSANEVMWLWRAQSKLQVGQSVYDPENALLGGDGTYASPWPLSKVTAEVRVSF
jgi:hypothetical protein